MENIFESDVRILEVLHEQQGIFEVSKVQKNSNSDILCMKKLHMGSLLEANTINREMSAMANISTIISFKSTQSLCLGGYWRSDIHGILSEWRSASVHRIRSQVSSVSH